MSKIAVFTVLTVGVFSLACGGLDAAGPPEIGDDVTYETAAGTQPGTYMDTYGKLSQVLTDDIDMIWIPAETVRPAVPITEPPAEDSCSHSPGASLQYEGNAATVSEVYGSMAQVSTASGPMWVDCGDLEVKVARPSPRPTSGGNDAAVSRCKSGCNKQCRGARNKSKCVGQCRRACSR